MQRFLVVPEFSEAVDPKLRRKRLAGILRRARSARHQLQARPGTPELKGRQRKALRVYRRKRKRASTPRGTSAPVRRSGWGE